MLKNARYIGWFLFCCVVSAALIFTQAQDTQSFCDPGISVDEREPNAYQDIDNRCEGLFVQEVSSSVIVLTSFTRQFDLESTGADHPATISWDIDDVTSVRSLQNSKDDLLRLRANSNAFRVYYRMDTRVPLDNTTFDWSTTILERLSMGKFDVGIYGFLPVSFSDVTRNIYFPLSLSQDGNINYEDYQVTLFPTAELEEVTYYIASVDEGYPGDVVVPETSLNYRNYPNATPIMFEFELTADTGLYYLNIEAERPRGRRSRREIYFYHEEF
ncbi:MAG: hypothetical protein AAF708_17840 [Deinococcota bacterium]